MARAGEQIGLAAQGEPVVCRTLNSQSFSCNATSMLSFEEGAGAHLAKYLPLTSATSGDEAR
jgi:hypothetical protein